MTELLEYSSNEFSRLNNLRRQLWSSRWMQEEGYDAEHWANSEVFHRQALEDYARDMRKRLPALSMFRVVLEGEEIQFIVHVQAVSEHYAIRKAQARHKGFKAIEARHV